MLHLKVCGSFNLLIVILLVLNTPFDGLTCSAGGDMGTRTGVLSSKAIPLVLLLTWSVSSGKFEVFLLPGIGLAAFGSSIRGSFGWGVLLQVMWVESSPSCLPSCYLFHIE